jgi:hypothetical protein
MLWWFKWRGWLSGYGEDRPRSDDEKSSVAGAKKDTQI